jgi:hypothetical protein
MRVLTSTRYEAADAAGSSERPQQRAPAAAALARLVLASLAETWGASLVTVVRRTALLGLVAVLLL